MTEQEQKKLIEDIKKIGLSIIEDTKRLNHLKAIKYNNDNKKRT